MIEKKGLHKIDQWASLCRLFLIMIDGGREQPTVVRATLGQVVLSQKAIQDKQSKPQGARFLHGLCFSSHR